jgi:hypothetical protein
LEKLASDEAMLHEQIAAHEQGDFAGLGVLLEKQSEYNAKRDQLEIEWLETSESLSIQ